MTGPDSARAWLNGLAILVVEDETIVSFMVEDMLAELGCETVWQAGSVRDALALLDEKKPNAVVLDVNLAGEYAYPVAARLAAANIPFVFATGYGGGGIPREWAARPVIQKPFSFAMLEKALRSLLAA